MENLKEIKLMMERLESPRMTDTEYQKRRNSIKEEEGDQGSSKPMGAAELKKATKDTSKIMTGLSGDDKIAYEGLLKLAEKLKSPGNQIVGKFKTRLFQLFKEAGINIK